MLSKGVKVRKGQVRTGPVRTGQVRTGQVRTGQVRIGRLRTGQVNLDQILGKDRSIQVGLVTLDRSKSFWTQNALENGV